MKTINLMKMGLLALMSAFVLSSCGNDEPDPIDPEKPDQPTEEVFTSEIYVPVHRDTKDLLIATATVTIDGKTTTYENVAAEWNLIEDEDVRKMMEVNNRPEILVYGKTVESKKQGKLTLTWTLSDDATAEEYNFVAGCKFWTTSGNNVIGANGMFVSMSDMNTQKFREYLDASLNNGLFADMDLRCEK